jgi:hypothetical protein
MCLHTGQVGRTHEVSGIEGLPIYLVSANQPRTISEDDFIDGVPLGDLMKRLTPGEHLYLVDYASDPARIKLTCLI